MKFSSPVMLLSMDVLLFPRPPLHPPCLAHLLIIVFVIILHAKVLLVIVSLVIILILVLPLLLFLLLRVLLLLSFYSSSSFYLCPTWRHPPPVLLHYPCCSMSGRSSCVLPRTDDSARNLISLLSTIIIETTHCCDFFNGRLAYPTAHLLDHLLN